MLRIIKKIIAVLGVIGLPLLAMEDPRVFINIPSILIVVGMTASALLFSDAKIKTAEFWRLARKYSIGSGVVGTVIGLVLMLANLEDPAAIGPSMAIALLTVFYGTFIGLFIARPLENQFQDTSS